MVANLESSVPKDLELYFNPQIFVVFLQIFKTFKGRNAKKENLWKINR
jgi:hypothetical protein